MTKTFSESEISVMHYLFNAPFSDDKRILVAIHGLQGKAALTRVLENLRGMGLVLSKQGVLHALSDLGKVVIGKAEANGYLASEIVRRGLPILTNARQGEGGQSHPLTSATAMKPVTPAKPAVVNNDPLLRKPTLKDEVPNGIYVEESAMLNVAKEDADLELPGAMREWKLSDAERTIMLGSDGVKVSKDDKVVAGLVWRGLVGVDENTLHFTTKGLRLKNGLRVVPCNTDAFALSRLERLIIEVMSLNDKTQLLKRTLLGALDGMGEACSQDNIDRAIKALESYGLIAQKTNNQYYLVSAMLPLLGLRPITPGKKSVISALPGGSRLLDIVESRKASDNKLERTLSEKGVTLVRAELADQSGDSKEVGDTPSPSRNAVSDKSTNDIAPLTVLPQESAERLASAEPALADAQSDLELIDDGGAMKRVDDVGDATQSYPTQCDLDLAESLDRQQSEGASVDGGFVFDVQALQLFKTKIGRIDAPKIDSPEKKAAFLLHLSELFTGDAGASTRAALSQIAIDLNVIDAYQRESAKV